MIRIFVTGGTFDKEYDELSGKLDFGETLVPQLLEQGRCRLDTQVETLMMIDSLDMNMENRKSILRSCMESPEKHIVITHGTDTICDTAMVIAEADLNKTIVLTGAMIPIRFGSSDGLFNFGAALAYVQALPPGVYVAMNGKCFMAGKVRKNRETGYFEEIG
jgi:L-asparaginase